MSATVRSVVLIGMPGCGKSTVSRELAAALARPWYDSDAQIETQAGMSITEIFARYGEAYFRLLERDCIRRLLSQEGIVLAVGGGAVLQNGTLLRARATVIYLHRDIADILTTLQPGTRPLLDHPDKLYALYEQRHTLYEALCDFRICNDHNIADTVKRIREVLT